MQASAAAASLKQWEPFVYCARVHTCYVADCSRSKLGRLLVILKSLVGSSSPLLLSVSNRRSRGKCSTYYLVSVTSARW